jgi:hypothetical protein
MMSQDALTGCIRGLEDEVMTERDHVRDGASTSRIAAPWDGAGVATQLDSGATENAAVSSWLMGAGLCLAVLAPILLFSPGSRHWFVVPVLASGILIAHDAVDWFRGRVPLFDPQGMFGLFGFHFFFLAYLLHVPLGFFWHYRFPPSDWRPWLGYSAALNVIGLVLYRWMLSRVPSPRPGRTWVLHEGRFFAITGGALVGALGVQAFIYSRFGGILGAAYARETGSFGIDPFEGLGWAISLAECFPVVLVIGLIVLTRKARFWKSLYAVPALVAGTLVIALLFGGVRGSRSSIFIVLFWAVVLFHMYVRPVGRKLVLIGPVLLFIFMTGYVYYKHGGVSGAEHLGDQAIIQEIEDRYGSGSVYSFILLHDLARADSQALFLYLDATEDNYRYAMGRTFVAGVLSVVPRALWAGRPEGANLEKASLMYGPGSHRIVFWSFGLAGEALLNFGPLSMPLALLACAGMVRFAKSKTVWEKTGDSRLLIWPLLLFMCFVTPIGEMQVVMWMLVKNGIVPFAVIVLSSDRNRWIDSPQLV